MRILQIIVFFLIAFPLSAGDADEAKKNIFAWLYNPNSQNKEAERFYNRDSALRRSNWNGNSITNYFGREIVVDERSALNYLLQSTLSDLFLRKKIELYRILLI